MDIERNSTTLRTAKVAILRGCVDRRTLVGALGETFDTEILDADRVSDLASELRDQVAVVILRSGSRLGLDELRMLPNLRCVLRPGSGTDNIDTDALRKRQIHLHTAPSIAVDAVGEWVAMATVSLARRVPLGHNGILAGAHLKSQCIGRSMSTLSVGIWGAGPVGHASARALVSAGVQVVRFAEWPSNNVDPFLEASADVLLNESDVHVIALPLRGSTRGMFGNEFVGRVRSRKPSIICVGRHETVSLSALVSGVVAGEIFGLAIDPIDSAEPIRSLIEGCRPLNLLMTPHLAAQREDRRFDAASWCADLIREFFDRRRGEAIEHGKC